MAETARNDNSVRRPSQAAANSDAAFEEIVRGGIQACHNDLDPATFPIGECGGRICKADRLKSVSDNTIYPMFEESNQRRAGCDIQDARLVTASAAIRDQVAAGRDLIILSKFGKLEVAGQGLRAAFTASINAGTPVLTHVPHPLYRAWKDFIGSQAIVLPFETPAIDDWLRSLLTIRRSMASPYNTVLPDCINFHAAAIHGTEACSSL